MNRGSPQLWFRYNTVLAVATAVFVTMFATFLLMHPRGLSVAVAGE
jgi:hypothetical protein